MMNKDVIELLSYVVLYPLLMGAAFRLVYIMICVVFDIPVKLYKNWVIYLVTALSFVVTAMLKMSVLVTIYVQRFDWLATWIIVGFWVLIFALVVGGQLVGDVLVGWMQEKKR